MSSVTIGLPFTSNPDELRLAIKSIFAQSQTDWRLVLIADGADASSLRVARQVRDARVALWDDGRRLGLAARLNQLASRATTEYLVRMDSDDVMMPDRLERQIKSLSTGDYDVIGSRAIALSPSGTPLGLFREPPLPTTGAGYLASNVFSHPTVAGRTEWFRRFRYREDLWRAQDKELWIRTFEKSRFWKDESPTIFYRLPGPRPRRIRHASFKADRSIVRQYAHLAEEPSDVVRLLSRSYAAEVFDLFPVAKRAKDCRNQRYTAISSQEVNRLVRVLDAIGGQPVPGLERA